MLHNRVADALSKSIHAKETPTDPSMLLTVSSIVPDLLIELQQHFLTHPDGQNHMQKYEAEAQSNSNIQITKGLILFQNRIFIPKYQSMRETLMNAFHSSVEGGHSGTKATLARLASSFFGLEYPKMLRDL